jgi:hypothetical protein
MPVKVRCSGCEKVLNAPDKLRGKTVKCPKCQSPIKIPAPEQKKTKQEPDAFGDDFLADLDLSQAEDQSQRICPRCGASVTEDDIDCPACGASLLAGGAVAGPGSKSPVGRKKKKGPNKSLFYRNAWSDAYAFLQKNKGYAIRTSLYVLILNTVFLGCVFMYNWCINPPPQAFWALLMFVFCMAPIGWVWHFVTESIKASLARQSKLKRVNFDFFTCVAYGIKFFAWQFLCGLPILLVAGIIGGFLFHSGAAIPGAIVLGVGALLIYSLLPVAMTHMAMPQQLPGWNPLKVFSGWAKSIGALSYGILILLLTSLPVTGCLGAIGATSANKIGSFYRTMARNNAIQLQEQEAEENDEVKPPNEKPAALPWNNLAIPGVLLGVACLLSGPVVVFNARIVGQIGYYYGPDMDLNPLEKQLKYRAKPKPGEDSEMKKINRQGLSTVGSGLNLMLAAIGINLLCQLASIALNLCAAFGLFVAPLIVYQILGFIVLGAGVLYLIGVLMCFAAPPEAKARGFLLLSFASPLIAMILGSLVMAGVATIADAQAMAITAVLLFGGIVLAMLLTPVFFILFLRRLSDYLYYYAGSDMADSLLILYVALFGVSLLTGALIVGAGAIGAAFIGMILAGIFAFVIIGIEISMLKTLIELLSGLKDECHKTY